MNRNELETLLGELKLKTPADEIKADEREIIQKFLEAERQYQSQHKIKRLLWLSGIRQVKTFEQFDWHFNPKVAKEDILSFDAGQLQSGSDRGYRLGSVPHSHGAVLRSHLSRISHRPHYRL